MTALFCKAREELRMGSTQLNLLNSHHTWHYSVSQLSSHEVWLLSLIIVAQCSHLDHATLLPATQDDNNHDCPTLTHYLLTR